MNDIKNAMKKAESHEITEEEMPSQTHELLSSENQDKPETLNLKIKSAYLDRDEATGPMWEVIGSNKCPFTEQVIALLTEHGEPNVHTSMIENQTAYQALIRLGRYSVPCVLKNGRFFGGLAEVEGYYRQTFLPENYQAL